MKKYINFIVLSFLTINISFAQSNKELKEVLSNGYGRDIPEAAQNAAENALKNVVGTFIDSSKAFEKRVQIQDGIKTQTKEIKTDIKEYSQGAIQKFEILDAVKKDQFVKVRARVVVRIDDFRVYVKKLAETEVELNEGLFAQMQTEKKQNKNAGKLLYENILLPLVNGEGIDFKVSAPKPFSQMDINTSNLLLDEVKFLNKYGGESVIGFIVNAELKSGFMENLIKILESMAKSKREHSGRRDLSGETLLDDQIREARGSNFDYQADIDVTVIKDQPGSKLEDIRPKFTYIIPGAKREFGNTSSWSKALVSQNSELGEWEGVSILYSENSSTPSKTLQVDFLDKSGQVLQREKIKENNRTPRIVLIPLRKEAHFSTSWSLAGKAQVGNGGGPLIRESNQFILLIAVNEDALKKSKSVSVKLVN